MTPAMTPAATREIAYREAINEAIRQEMQRDPTIIVMGEDIAGAAAATYTIGNYQPEHMGRYEVVIRNATGYTRSTTAVLDAILPTIGAPEKAKLISGANVTMTAAPTPVQTVIGIHTNVVLRVEPQGTGPFGYQWSFNGEASDGAIAATVDLG